jgi:membrane-bound metal-dependent hydrolase YbcI (DUF457 family)
MFLGHFAVGLAGKRFAPRASLATLIFAPMFLDLIWPIFLLLGWEHVKVEPGITAVTPFAFTHYPWSHSLHMTLFWSGLVAIVFRAMTRDSRAAIWMGCAVASHWFLDWITHVPDLPLWPTGPKVGLGLWHSVAGTLILEMLMFLVGLYMYLRVTRPRGGRGRLSLWLLIVTLTVLYFVSLRPLPVGLSERAIGMMGLVMWLFLPWAWWIESTRRTVR